MASTRIDIGVTPSQQRRVSRAAHLSFDTIPGFPNWFPFNEMVLDGILKIGEYGVKTRPLPWNHRGLTLFYSSSRVCMPAAKAHGYDPKKTLRGLVLGSGDLVDIRELTKAEMIEIACQFNNMDSREIRKHVHFGGGRRGYYWRKTSDPLVLPYQLGYFFKDLRRFETPVPFAWPSGPVRTTPIPLALVASALKAAGVREINGIRI